jgi:hypothetical protein
VTHCDALYSDLPLCAKFVLIGWWFSAIWLAVAWALHVSIIGMLVGFWMFNRTATLVSLAR